MTFGIDIDDAIVARMREMSLSGRSATDVLEYLVSVTGDRGNIFLCVAYFTAAFGISLQHVKPIGGWSGFEFGELSDESVNEFLDPYMPR